ncbi:MAG TPA: hypothetical protein VK638_17820 [Edaphobacter sp.]|nr:hypothetical protein [Edaphobacter sp.]
MVAALRIRRHHRLQHLEMLAGIIASTSANFSFCRPEKAMSPADFMLHKLPPEPEKPVSYLDIRAAFGSRIKQPIQ